MFIPHSKRVHEIGFSEQSVNRRAERTGAFAVDDPNGFEAASVAFGKIRWNQLSKIRRTERVQVQFIGDGKQNWLLLPLGCRAHVVGGPSDRGATGGGGSSPE